LFWGRDGLNEWRDRNKSYPDEEAASGIRKVHGGVLAQFIFVEKKKGHAVAMDFLLNGEKTQTYTLPNGQTQTYNDFSNVPNTPPVWADDAARQKDYADLAKLQVFMKPWPGMVSLIDVSAENNNTQGELPRFVAMPGSAPAALHVVVEAETLRLGERNWNPPSTRGKAAEVFETPTSQGQLCQLRLLGDKIEWVTPPASMSLEGMKVIEAAEHSALALTANVRSIKLENMEKMSIDIDKQMLTIHHRAGKADTLFSMNLANIREWDEIVTKYAMKQEKMRILGHQGGMIEHPLVNERVLRHGDDAEQMWYCEREVIQPPPPKKKDKRRGTGETSTCLWPTGEDLVQGMLQRTSVSWRWTGPARAVYNGL
jgi:hypothetical protein